MGLFKDKSVQESFDKNGFVCLPAIDADAAERLTKLYGSVNPASDTGIYSNLQDQPEDLNRRIGDEFKATFKDFIEEHFTDVQVSGSAYLVKQTGSGSQSQLHQDYTLVDEREQISVSIWCPMVDVDESNGCLQVIPGSHKMFSTIRSVNIPSIYLEFEDKLEKYLTSVPVKKGTAVVYAHNLFHGSKPNLTDQIRIAAVLSVASNKADLLHYFKQDKDVLQVEVDESFYYKTMPAYRTEQTLVGVKKQGTFPFQKDKILNKSQVYSKLESSFRETKKKRGILQRLFG